MVLAHFHHGSTKERGAGHLDGGGKGRVRSEGRWPVKGARTGRSIDGLPIPRSGRSPPRRLERPGGQQIAKVASRPQDVETPIALQGVAPLIALPHRLAKQLDGPVGVGSSRGPRAVWRRAARRRPPATHTARGTHRRGSVPAPNPRPARRIPGRPCWPPHAHPTGSAPRRGRPGIRPAIGVARSSPVRVPGPSAGWQSPAHESGGLSPRSPRSPTSSARPSSASANLL